MKVWNEVKVDCAIDVARNSAARHLANKALGRGDSEDARAARGAMRATGQTVALAAALVLAAWSPWVGAQPDPSLAEVPSARLQAMVLACDLKAPQRQAAATAAFCEAAADTLQRRLFGGDRERLLAWWRAARAAPRGDSASAPAARAPGRSGASGAGRPPSTAMPASMRLPELAPAQLKAAYLQCNQLAETSLLDFGTAAGCSMVYEALKERVFGGDFHRLLAWSREQRPAGGADQPSGAAGAGAGRR